MKIEQLVGDIHFKIVQSIIQLHAKVDCMISSTLLWKLDDVHMYNPPSDEPQ